MTPLRKTLSWSYENLRESASNEDSIRFWNAVLFFQLEETWIVRKQLLGSVLHSFCQAQCVKVKILYIEHCGLFILCISTEENFLSSLIIVSNKLTKFDWL